MIKFLFLSCFFTHSLLADLALLTSPFETPTAHETVVFAKEKTALQSELLLCNRFAQAKNSSLFLGLKSAHESKEFYTNHCKSKNSLAWLNSSLEFTPQALELLEAVEASGTQGLSPNRYNYKMIQETIQVLKTNVFANEAEKYAKYNRLDILMSDAYLTLAKELYYGFTDWKIFQTLKTEPKKDDTNERKFEWDRDKKSALMSVKYLTKNLEQNSISTSLEALRPNFIEYTRMMDALKYYRELTEKGGWQTIPAGPTIRIGHNDARVELIKKRLFATAELKEITTLEHTTYDEEELIEAVKSFQKSHNLKPDGLIGKKTIHALNVPASKIVEKIILNLERFRWLTPNLDKVPGYISINIPAFKMQLYEEGHERINMKVIVGRKDRPTPVTHSKLSYAVLNPSWTAPQTIIKEDILAKNNIQAYLESHDMEVFAQIDGESVPINPEEIDWDEYADRNHVPFIFKASTGKSNPLGDVKFMFNNKYSVYMHDTNQRYLFANSTRAYSSGCIRLEEPTKLLTYLLENKGNIANTQEKSQDKVVQLKKKLPLIIRYMTAEVDESNKVYFYDDIYGYDERHLLAVKGFNFE